MRTKILLAGCALLLLLSAPLAAQVTPRGQSLSYSYIEGGWSRVNIDPGSGFSSVNENGFNFRGSAQVSDNAYLFGAWDRWEIGPFDDTTDLTKLGAGIRGAVNPTMDWYAEGSWTRIEIDNFGKQNGGRGDVGLRSRLGELAELRGFVGYNFDGPEDDSLVLGGEVMFHFNPQFGLSAGVETYEFDVNIYRVNLRLSF